MLFCFVISSYGQIETSAPLTIDLSGLNVNEDPVNESPNNNTNLNTPKEIELPEVPNVLSPKSLDGLNNYKSNIDADNFGTLNPKKIEFGAAPTVNKYLTNKQPNYLKKEKGITAVYQRDQSLGDIRTKSKFLILKFRDYSNVDGDIVRLIVNDEIVVHRSILVGNFSQFKVPLPEDGFYKIDFMALNMGQFAPNTAQLKIVDDKFDTLLNDKWSLSTGFKATVVIIKE